MSTDDPEHTDDDAKQPNVKQWLCEHGLSAVAELITEVEAEWARAGKKTRRNWWDVLAGGPDGKPRVVAGRTFPVIEEARRRQGLAVDAESAGAQAATSESANVSQPSERPPGVGAGPEHPSTGHAPAEAAREEAVRAVGQRSGVSATHASPRPSVLITGASSGIGRATAALFAAEGYRVFGTSRRTQPDQDGVEMLELDVRSDDSVAGCLAQLQARAGAIDVLVNNAGVEHLGIAEETSIDEARAVFETNFFGVVRMTHAVLPAMRERRRGRIINVGSAATWVGEPGEAFYSASKRALAGYTEALHHEVWPFGIHVSLIEPGAFKTQILQVACASSAMIADYDDVRRAARDTLHDSQRRGGDPRAVARAIVKVARTASPRLRYGVGAEAVWLPYLKLLMPQRWFDRALRRGFGLHGHVG